MIELEPLVLGFPFVSENCGGRWYFRYSGHGGRVHVEVLSVINQATVPCDWLNRGAHHSFLFSHQKYLKYRTMNTAMWRNDDVQAVISIWEVEAI